MASPLTVLCLAVKNADPLFAMNVLFNRKRSTNAITFSQCGAEKRSVSELSVRVVGMRGTLQRVGRLALFSPTRNL